MQSKWAMEFLIAFVQDLLHKKYGNFLISSQKAQSSFKINATNSNPKYLIIFSRRFLRYWFVIFNIWLKLSDDGADKENEPIKKCAKL